MLETIFLSLIAKHISPGNIRNISNWHVLCPGNVDATSSDEVHDAFELQRETMLLLTARNYATIELQTTSKSTST